MRSSQLVKESPHILWNPKFQHHIHKSVTCPYHTFPPYFFNSNFNNILTPQFNMFLIASYIIVISKHMNTATYSKDITFML